MKSDWRKYKNIADKHELKQIVISMQSGASLKTVSDYFNGRSVSKKMSHKIETFIDKETSVVKVEKGLERQEINLALLSDILKKLPEQGQNSLVSIAKEIELMYRVKALQN